MTSSPCLVDGCPEVAVHRGRCAAHRPARSPSSRVTGTRRWRELKDRLLARPDWQTCACGAPATTVDHVVPIALGGAPWDEDNLAPSCEPCNLAKGARHARARA